MLKRIMQPGFLTSRRSPFFRNTMKLFIGSGSAQAISVLISPLLTRLFSPDDFGLYTFYIYIAAVIILISSLRYELAIVYSEDDKQSVGVISLSVLIALGVSALILLIVLTYHIFLYQQFKINPILLKWFYLLPILVFCMGVGNALQNWLVRKKEFRIISISKVVNSAANNGIMLLLGLAGCGVWGLFTGYFAGSLIFVFFLLFQVLTKQRNISRLFDRSLIKPMAVKFKELPLSNSPQAFFEILQSYGIIYLAKIFFSSSIVGFYALSMRVLQAPLWLIGSAFFQVYMQDAADRFNRKETLEKIFNKTIKMAALAVLPVLIILITIGPQLFGLVFGPNWREAGVYARILAPWMFFDFIRYTISQTPLIVGKTRTMFYISLIGNVLMIGSMCIGGLWLHDVRTGFIILSSSMSCYAIAVILWIKSISTMRKSVIAGSFKDDSKERGL